MESRSIGPKDKNRKLRRRVKFTDPFGKRWLRGGIRVGIGVKPLDKVLNWLRTEFTFR